jgi:CheY-like chemotaxis protein
MAELLTSALEAGAYHVERVTTVRDLDKRPRARRPRVILVDLGGGGLAALDVVDQLYRDPALREIPVIAVSSSDDVLRQAKTWPNVKVTVKCPFEPERLLVYLDQLGSLG